MPVRAKKELIEVCLMEPGGGRRHVYFRANDEAVDRVNPTPAHSVRTLICIQRLTEEEFAAGPAPTAR